MLTEVTFCYWTFFCFHVVKPLMLILPLFPILRICGKLDWSLEKLRHSFQFFFCLNFSTKWDHTLNWVMHTEVSLLSFIFKLI